MPETENKSKIEKKPKSRGFFGNMAVELKKVIWPSPEQTAKSTAATIAFVLLISAILIVLDLLFRAVSGAWWSFWQ